MVKDQPNVNLESRYSVNETATLLGIHRNTLLKYDRCGLIKHGNRRIGRNGKFYTGRAILSFWNAQR